MEKEICKIETTRKPTSIFRCLAYFFTAFSALCLITDIFVVSSHADWEIVFKDMSYIIPIIIAVGSALFAALFFSIKGKSSISILLVLTDKRVYVQTETSKTKKTESYNLDTITYHSFSQKVRKSKAHSTLTFKTEKGIAKFDVDEEFYNEFVKATNSTKSKE